MKDKSNGDQKNINEGDGHFFRIIAAFVGSAKHSATALRASALIIEKHIPQIVSEFYINLLKYPETRKIFLSKDGSIDAQYLQLRMYHQAICERYGGLCPECQNSCSHP